MAYKICFRISEAKTCGMPVVDVDGSYLVHKHQKLQQAGLNVAPLKLPSMPLTSWESIDDTNFKEATKNMPKLTSGAYTIVTCMQYIILTCMQEPYIPTWQKVSENLEEKVHLELCLGVMYTGDQDEWKN